MLNTSKTIQSAQSENGKILLDIRHGQIFSVNIVGAKILDLIEQGREEGEIADEIARSYTVGVEAAHCDVHAFIDALRKHRIVQAAASAESPSPR